MKKISENHSTPLRLHCLVGQPGSNPHSCHGRRARPRPCFTSSYSDHHLNNRSLDMHISIHDYIGLYTMYVQIYIYIYIHTFYTYASHTCRHSYLEYIHDTCIIHVYISYIYIYIIHACVSVLCIQTKEWIYMNQILSEFCLVACPSVFFWRSGPPTRAPS